MSELIWFNGETIPMSEARPSVEDRGSQFADGVYEVIRLYDGKPFTLAEHLERLRKSATSIKINLPLGVDALASEIRKFIPKTPVTEGMIYLQLTRGVCPRNHLFPETMGGQACKPTLYFYAVIGGRVVTHPVGPKVLPGITRAVLLEVASELGVPMDERPLREEEASSADEIFITSTTREISWVSAWNGQTVGGGRCGPIAKRLHEGLAARVQRETR
jgi:branched-subunit amino acid aminotransferase/4-amino-4-deoxychorismate lyase